MTIDAALRAAVVRLAEASPSARLDAELLMAHALGTSWEAMLLGDRGGAVPDAFAALVERRLAHEPIAYIIGIRAFWTIDLAVGPGVLVPRPDSETLIEAAIAHFGKRSPATILDLGTGSGALLLAALAQWPQATGVGIDLSEAALAIAHDNAARLGMADRARFLRSDWSFDPTSDLVLCNPPYIATGESLPDEVARYEPASALYAGADGLDAYRRLAPLTRFAPGGCACFEIGATQGEAVRALFEAEGFVTRMVADIAGRDRCIQVIAS